MLQKKSSGGRLSGAILMIFGPLASPGTVAFARNVPGDSHAERPFYRSIITRFACALLFKSILESAFPQLRIRVLNDGEDARPIKVIPRMAITIDLAIRRERYWALSDRQRDVAHHDARSRDRDRLRQLSSRPSVGDPPHRERRLVPAAPQLERGKTGETRRVRLRVLRRFRSFSVGTLTTAGTNGDRWFCPFSQIPGRVFRPPLHRCKERFRVCPIAT